MTHCVIDVLEAVEIEQQQRPRARPSAPAAEDPPDIFAKRMTVAQPGQPIVIGRLTQLLVAARSLRICRANRSWR
jgi:hypothetical protein